MRPRTGESLTISGRPLCITGQVSSYRASSSEASDEWSFEESMSFGSDIGGEGSVARFSQDSWLGVTSDFETPR